MSSEPKTPAAAPETMQRLPLFYREPQPLALSVHGAWRLKGGDASFAAETPFVPLVVGELAAAARCYPIVFAAGDAPIALLGLERINLFVDGGRWAADSYVQASVRPSPFGLIEIGRASGRDRGGQYV